MLRIWNSFRHPMPRNTAEYRAAPWPLPKTLHVPALDRSVHVAVALAVVYLTFYAFRHGADQSGHYPPWFLYASLTLFAVVAGWVAVDTFRGTSGVVRLGSFRALVILTIIVGAVSIPVASGLESVRGMPWQIDLMGVSSCVAAMAFGVRLGLAAVTIIWTEFFFLRVPHGVFQAFAETAALLAGGVFCATVLLVIQRDAELVAHIDTDAERLQDAREQMRQRHAAHQWWNSLVHDTVLGALLLAGRSDDHHGSSRQAARDLAREALHELRGLHPHAGEGRAQEVLEAHARTLGLWATGTVRESDAYSPARSEILLAAKEAITNVARHAGTSRVAISGDLSADATHLRVSDDGHGFDTTTPSSRLGVRQSIERRMQVVGGTALIESVPRVGTTVYLSWTPGDDETQHSAGWPHQHESILRPVLLLYGALQGVLGFVADHAVNDALTVVGALVMTVMLVVVLLPQVPDRWALTIAGVLPLLVTLLTINVEPMQVNDFRCWFIGGSFPILIGLVMRRQRAPAIVASVAATLGFLTAAHVFGVAPLIVAVNVSVFLPVVTAAAVALSLSLDGSARHIAAMNQRRAATRTSMARMRARELERQSRRQVLEDRLGPLLHRIASDVILEDADRAEALRAEAEIRDLLTARPLLDDAMRAVVRSARERGAIVTLTTESGATADGVHAAISQVLTLCAGACGLRSTLTARLTETAASGRCTIAVAGLAAPLQVISRANFPAHIDVEVSLDDDSALATLQWSTAPSPGADATATATAHE